jgi:hypothetical protein
LWTYGKINIELSEWRNELQAFGREGQAIDKNVQLETRVPENIQEHLERKILEQYKRTGNPIKSIEDAVSKTNNSAGIDSLLLKGPQATENLPDKFGRLNTYNSIRRLSKIDGAETMNEYQIPSEENFESGQTINLNDFPRGIFCNEYGFLWSTNVELIDQNLGIDELRCRLGIIVREGTLMLKIVYNRSFVDKCFIPTIIEGRDFPAFQPADVNEKSGYTRDLRDNRPRFPEWVHKGISIQEIESISSVIQGNSRIPDGQVPDGYLDEKLR